MDYERTRDAVRNAAEGNREHERVVFLGVRTQVDDRVFRWPVDEAWHGQPPRCAAPAYPGVE